MQLLKDRIIKDGTVCEGDILKVGGFLNHLIDEELVDQIGKEIAALFKGETITKIMTVEASGIPIACASARYLHAPVLFAKKRTSATLKDSLYSATVHSYTHDCDSTVLVTKDYLQSSDKVLIVDDFLANGCAIRGLMDLCRQAGATVVGCAIAIEKGYQGGGDALRSEGIRVESLALIDSMSTTQGIKFRA